MSFNYQNATEVCVAFLENKIEKSVKLYEANCEIADIVVDTEYYDYTYCKAEMNYYRSEDLHQAGLIEMETED